MKCCLQHALSIRKCGLYFFFLLYNSGFGSIVNIIQFGSPDFNVLYASETEVRFIWWKNFGYIYYAYMCRIWANWYIYLCIYSVS